MTDPATTCTLADVRRDVRTLLHSSDPAELGPAILRLEYWLDMPPAKDSDHPNPDCVTRRPA